MFKHSIVTTHGSSVKGKKITIPTDVVQALDAIPDTLKKPRTWVPWEDAALIKYSVSKPVYAIAQVLGRSATTCKDRLKFLKKELAAALED